MKTTLCLNEWIIDITLFRVFLYAWYIESSPTIFSQRDIVLESRREVRLKDHQDRIEKLEKERSHLI